MNLAQIIFLQALRSTEFCMSFNTKAQSVHTCVAVSTPDSQSNIL